MLYKHLCLLYISVLHPKGQPKCGGHFPLTPLVYIGFSKPLGLETLEFIEIQ